MNSAGNLQLIAANRAKKEYTKQRLLQTIAEQPMSRVAIIAAMEISSRYFWKLLAELCEEGKIVQFTCPQGRCKACNGQKLFGTM